MSNDVTKQPMDLYEKYAAEAAAVGGPRLKFVKGVFKIGDEVVDLNTEFIALMADVAQCWVRFENGKLTHSLLYKLADGFEPCQREELGDPESTWKWDRGKPRDPWALQWLLPLQSVDTEEATIFTTDSVGGSQAVKALIKEYNPRRNTGSLPIIALKNRSYTNDYGPQHAPIFSVVGWTPPSATGSPPIAPAAAIDVNTAAVKGITDRAAAAAAAEAAVLKNSDMDDEIPF